MIPADHKLSIWRKSQPNSIPSAHVPCKLLLLIQPKTATLGIIAIDLKYLILVPKKNYFVVRCLPHKILSIGVQRGLRDCELLWVAHMLDDNRNPEFPKEHLLVIRSRHEFFVVVHKYYTVHRTQMFVVGLGFGPAPNF
jgi:hypothetical protein